MLALDLQQVIQGCVRNERVSQERLYKEYYVPLFCMCRRFFENDHEAIESVNDGMMKVFGHITERKDLYILLDQLNPGTRVICNLYYIEGYSVKEIAENVGLTAGTIKWHLSESRKKLKSVLESHFNR